MGRLVLVVDDSAAIVEALTEVLTDDGYEVASARNGEVALKVLAAGPRPDVILLDMTMPVMDGQEFRARQLATPAFASIPTFVLSAAMPGRHATDMRVQDWFPKPIQLATLLSALRRYCEPRPKPRDHALCFYDDADEDGMLYKVGRFMEGALAKGGVAVAIATPPHVAGLRAALSHAGYDVAALEARGLLTLADAGQTLASLQAQDGTVDNGRLRQQVGAMLDRMQEGGCARVGAVGATRIKGPLRVYGEMVDLLWRRGDFAESLRLERLWNQYAREGRFALLCTYHAEALLPGRSSERAIADLHAEHSALV